MRRVEEDASTWRVLHLEDSHLPEQTSGCRAMRPIRVRTCLPAVSNRCRQSCTHRRKGAMEPVGDHCGSRRYPVGPRRRESGPHPRSAGEPRGRRPLDEQTKTEQYLVYGHRVVGRLQAERDTLYFDKRHSPVNQSNLTHCGACRGL